MFAQVVSSVYRLMEEYQSLWKGVKESQPVPAFGFRYEVGLEPVSVNVERMIGNFRLGRPGSDGNLEKGVASRNRRTGSSPLDDYRMKHSSFHKTYGFV